MRAPSIVGPVDNDEDSGEGPRLVQADVLVVPPERVQQGGDPGGSPVWPHEEEGPRWPHEEGLS